METYTDPTTGQRYGLGLIPSTPDQRRAFCSPWRGAVVPREKWTPIDFRVYAPDVFNQGEQGSCVGHGGIGSLMTLRKMHGHGDERLSPCNLYGQINGGQDRGAIVIDALKALRDTGACLEATVGPSRWQPSGWPSGWKDEAKRFRIEGADELTSFDEIGSAIMQGDPVNFGVMIGNRFKPQGAEGVIPEWDGSQAGGHCMFALGLKAIDGRWHLLVQNSWGTQWGAGGFCYMPESYFRQRFAEMYRLRTATDDPQDTNPPTVKG
jgi:hypothetical protein